MNKDLKLIKKKYGEKMMHFCRESFPTLLEREGFLFNLLQLKFNESRSLYIDISNNNLEEEFKNYIYSLVDAEENYSINVNKSPKELLKEVGYNLYYCKTEEEIQYFKKYYSDGEELCTFRGGRLNKCHVFFAVKENVAEIKREDFQNPKRQDLYGTSVISIQFERNDSHMLSIKNRYNHTVNSPDSTFGNNLDNIIPGLTESFAEYYGMEQKHIQGGFEIPGYVKANDGRFYKYNYEINNIYYCEDNIIIDNFEVKKYPKEEYIIFDYFIIDLKNKNVYLYDKTINDSFPKTLQNINKIEIRKEKKQKQIMMKNEEGIEEIKIVLDKSNNIISITNKVIDVINDNFLYYNKKLKELILPNVIIIRDNFLYSNTSLEELNLSRDENIGTCFLCHNEKLERLSLSEVRTIGDNFLNHNKNMKELNLPKATTLGDCFLYFNTSLQFLYLPNVITIEDKFLHFNKSLLKLNLPKVETIGNNFLYYNKSLLEIYLPNVVTIGDKFLSYNTSLEEITLPKVAFIGKYFLSCNLNLTKLSLPKDVSVGEGFLLSNKILSVSNLPDNNINKINY